MILIGIQSHLQLMSQIYLFCVKSRQKYVCGYSGLSNHQSKCPNYVEGWPHFKGEGGKRYSSLGLLKWLQYRGGHISGSRLQGAHCIVKWGVALNECKSREVLLVGLQSHKHDIHSFACDTLLYSTIE